MKQLNDVLTRRPHPDGTITAIETEFDLTTSVRLAPDQGDGGTRFDVDLHDAWSSLVGVHGGYMSAVAVRAAEVVVPDRRVRTSTTSFLRAGRVGPATVTVRPLRTGRSITTLTVDLSQGDRVVATTRATLTGAAEGVEWRSPVSLDLPAPEDCIPISPPWHVEHFLRADALIDPSSLPFTNGERARVSGYLRPLEPRPIDAAWLTMAVDWFPPPAFVRIDPPTGGISVDLTAHVHRVRPPLAESDWLIASFEITNSAGGLAVEHGLIAERDGTLLAESFQTRWTAVRATS